MDIFIDFGISTVLTLLKKIAKKEEDKAKWKKVMLKIATQIRFIYGDDEDFE